MKMMEVMGGWGRRDHCHQLLMLLVAVKLCCSLHHGQLMTAQC